MTLEAIADLVGGRVAGEGSVEIRAISPVDEAGVGEMAFLASPRYAKHVPGCVASAYLVSADMEKELPDDAPRVVVQDGYAALRLVLRRFFPPDEWEPSVHPTAILGKDVELGKGVEIGPYVVLGAGVRVGAHSRIGAHCVIGAGSAIGDRTRLHPHAVAYDDTVIGSDVIVHSGARLGADGFGYTLIDGEHAKMPQVGRCVIEDSVEVGANSTIDRGSLGDTRVGPGVKIDNLVHIGHNVKIGARSLLAALVGIAGSTRIGKGVWFGGQSGAIDQLTIGDEAKMVVQTGVTRDVPAGETVSGFPARPHREELARQAYLGRLPDLSRRVARLEREMERFAPPGGDPGE